MQLFLSLFMIGFIYLLLLWVLIFPDSSKVYALLIHKFQGPYSLNLIWFYFLLWNIASCSVLLLEKCGFESLQMPWIEISPLRLNDTIHFGFFDLYLTKSFPSCRNLFYKDCLFSMYAWLFILRLSDLKSTNSCNVRLLFF